MKKNESNLDQTIRIILAIILGLIAYFSPTRTWQIVFYILAIISALSSLMGFCPLYAIFGIDTTRKTGLKDSDKTDEYSDKADERSDKRVEDSEQPVEHSESVVSSESHSDNKEASAQQTTEASAQPDYDESSNIGQHEQVSDQYAESAPEKHQGNNAEQHTEAVSSDSPEKNQNQQ